MNITLILIVLAVVAAVVLVACKGGGSTPKPPPAEPVVFPPSRPGLYFGYFGSDDTQPSETRDHTNIFFEMAWGGITDRVIARIADAAIPTVLAVDAEMFTNDTPRVYLGKNLAQANLREKFNMMKMSGVLQYVAALYPLDEPDLQNYGEDIIKQYTADLREVMAEYPELVGKPLAVFYADHQNYPGIRYFDWVGFDDYGHREKIFTDGKYSQFRSLVQGNQRIMLIPGGADPWKQDPTKFYEKAQSDSAVIAIIAFIYLDNAGGSTNLGIRSNGTLPVWYRPMGLAIKNAS